MARSMPPSPETSLRESAHLGLFTIRKPISPSGTALRHYYSNQLYQSLSGLRSVDHGRLYTLGNITVSMIYPSVLPLVVWVCVARPIYPLRRIATSKGALLILFIAIASSFPLLASPRQYRHYIVPSLPFYAIYLSMLFLPVFAQAEKKMKLRFGEARVTTAI